MINIRTLIFALIIILLVSIIILQIVTISNFKKKKLAEENQKQDIFNLMMMNVLNNMNNSNPNNPNTSLTPAQSCELDSPQTSFFAKSIDHAEKVLMGKVYLDGYKYGNAIDLTRLDDATKKSAIIAMKYMMVDSVSARNIEQKFRQMSEQENVPLWFVILHESIKKLIPIDYNLNVSQISDEILEYEIERRKLIHNSGGNVVPINKVA